MCTAFLGMVACTGLEPYKITAPEDLAEKIAEYKAEKEAQKTDDYEEIDISVAVVGSEDNTAGWWEQFSQYFTVPSGKLLTINFVNNGTGTENWHNWNLCLSNKERDTEGYQEYFVIRADRYGWGNGDFLLGLMDLTINGVAEADWTGDVDFWTTFREKMNGASVKMEIDHSRTGYAFVTATAVATDGTILVETYNQKVSATEDVEAFLIVDHSHLDMQSANLTPSQVAEIPDENVVGIQITGFPASVEVGTTFEEVLQGELVVTAIYEDNSTAVVSLEDVSFTVAADFGMNVGKETVLFSYSKTKQGNYGPAVASYVTIEVTNPIVSIEVTKAPAVTTYYFFENESIAFRSAGMEVTATYADETTGVMELSSLTIADIKVEEGDQDVTIAYKNGDKEISTTTPITLIKGDAGIGLPDCTGGFWSAFTEDIAVPAGSSVSFELELYSAGLEFYHGPVAVLRKADLTLGADGEYAVVRIDNFGWGGGFANIDENKESDWNWDLFKTMLSGSHMTITATNNGDNTASIRYDVTWPNGDSHFQLYKNIQIDSTDANLALTIDHCYLVIVK